jgi:hypothetical protein
MDRQQTTLSSREQRAALNPARMTYRVRVAPSSAPW